MKNVKRLVLLLGVSVFAFGMLTGCGGSSDEGSYSDGSYVEDTSDTEAEADITGDWKLVMIEDADGNQQTLAEYCESQGVDSHGVEATYNFDGAETVTGAIGGVAVEGTYTFDGSTIVVTFNGTDSEMTYDADQDMIYCADANSGMTSYMERQ